MDDSKSVTEVRSVTTKKRFEPEFSVWAPDAKQLLESAQLDQVIKKIRIQQQYPLQFKQRIQNDHNEHSKFKQDWFYVEKLLVVAMLYHSGSLTDVHKYSELDDAIIRQGINQQESNDEV